MKPQRLGTRDHCAPRRAAVSWTRVPSPRGGSEGGPSFNLHPLGWICPHGSPSPPRGALIWGCGGLWPLLLLPLENDHLPRRHPCPLAGSRWRDGAHAPDVQSLCTWTGGASSTSSPPSCSGVESEGSGPRPSEPEVSSPRSSLGCIGPRCRGRTQGFATGKKPRAPLSHLMQTRSWWWTGRPGILQSMGLQRVGPDWVTELNWTELGSWAND